MTEQSTGASGVPSRYLRFAPWLLLVAVAARLAWSLLSPNGMNFVDLHVYVYGSAALHGGDLYDFTYSDVTPDFPLPFTYPPFAALVFFPLHFLPFTLIAIVWQLATVAALYWVVKISLRLLLGSAVSEDPTRWRLIAMVWTAIGMWTEPVRTTLDYGQVNVFLALGTMLAVRSARWWLSGLLVGIVAGIKLTPAITGLYFLARRRFAAAVASAVFFAASVGVSYLVIGAQARRYFEDLIGDPRRVGPVGSVWNQSLRGAISRILGHDVKIGPLLIVAILVFLVLAVVAWRSLGRDDRLGTLIVVQFVGLLISPISWSHHWVWVIPMAIWLLHGPHARRLGTKILLGYWAVTTIVGVPWILGFFQDSIWMISRPAILSWLGIVYVLGVLGFYGWVIYAGRTVTSTVQADSRQADRSSLPG